MTNIQKSMQKMLASGKIRGGQILLVDCYNQAVYEDICCTITTRFDGCNQYWVATPIKDNEKSKVKRTNIPYDDYNSRIPPPSEQNQIGTIVSNCGRTAFRDGWKLIEVCECNEESKVVGGIDV